MGGPRTAKLIVWRLQSKSKQPSYRYILVGQGLPNFLTRDLVTLNKTLSIYLGSTRLLVTGPIRNA